MKRVLGIIVALVALMTGCAESTIERVNTNTTASSGGISSNQSDAQTTPTSQENRTNAPEIYQVGDTVRFDNLQITLNSVKEVREAEFFTPDNDKYLLIDLTIENAGSESEAISTLLQMELLDADSYTYSITIYPDAKGSIDGEIGAGRKVRGEVAFDVPDSEYYEFVFEDPFTSGQAIWRIESSEISQ